MKTYGGVEVGGQVHVPAVLSRGKRPQYPLDRRLSGPQIPSGRCEEEKNRDPAAIWTQAVQPVARHYTDWAIPTWLNQCSYQKCKKKKGKAIPVTGRGGFWDVDAPTFSRKSAHGWRWHQLSVPATLCPPGRFLVVISVRGWVDLRAIVRLEGLG
jgi:hypothetical protein